jgi:uncharacterized protein
MIENRITGGYWAQKLETNAKAAIFHQWEQLQASGCIHNFRIAAGEADGFREGWFFADSDAYKWLEAAVRIQALHPDDQLSNLLDELIALLGRAQMDDGYIFTYNQILFPETRWQNLQIEHELYCHGHLIEAGVSHYEVSGRTELLDIARKAADRIVEDFLGKGPDFTPGHEEIELALLRLHVVVGDQDGGIYMAMARQFIEQRGRNARFTLSILRQNAAVGKRAKQVEQKKREYMQAHPGFIPYQLPPGNQAKKPANSAQRWYASALSGKYFQQHAPVRKQTVPVGHSVRFAYLETAVAMLARETDDPELVSTLERAWNHMVTRRIYVTAGIGSNPGLEGFGNDYELDPEYAYAETCAALASMFWNWQMVQLTGEAKYSDLLEWQLYNAAAVGMALDGKTYLYNNPLACRGGVERKPWYAVPCCPSNLSRTWADLGKYILSSSPGSLRLHQYITSHCRADLEDKQGRPINLSLSIDSGLPWDGSVEITLEEIAQVDSESVPFSIVVRQPSWASNMTVTVNGNMLQLESIATGAQEVTASGYDPRLSIFHSITRTWAAGDRIRLEVDMPVVLREAHPKVKQHRGQAAITRGPLVYCLESIDHPNLDLFSIAVDRASPTYEYDSKLLGGAGTIRALSVDGARLTLIPYHLWGNRGASQMNVWLNVGSKD